MEQLTEDQIDMMWEEEYKKRIMQEEEYTIEWYNMICQ